MEIVVQKFGGTSVATKDLREKIAQRVINAKISGKYPVVVVSAIGRNGDPYATDTLMNFANSIHNESFSRELDLIMSCGEIISSVIMANTIKSMGYDAVALTGYQAGIITDNNFGDAEIIEVNPSKIINLLKNDKIVIITGFQGSTVDGDITTLGRGGSDTTAAIIGEALKCESVEIYTDVDGVMTADPKLVPDASVINTLCYDEIYQMAKDGAKVVHPKAIAVARRGNLTLKIKNTFNESDGTTINNHYPYSMSYKDTNTISNLITAIAHKNNIAQIVININSGDHKNKLLLDELEKNRISIDMINFFEDRKIFTVEDKDLYTLNNILSEYGFDYYIVNNCCKITAIGHKIHGVPGVMSKLVRVLSANNIKILQSSDSHTTISCLIEDKYLSTAVNTLHNEFNLYK